MSCYFSEAKRKKEDEWETVEMIDDFYGKHQYAVRFSNGDTYPENEVIVKPLQPSKESPEDKDLEETFVKRLYSNYGTISTYPELYEIAKLLVIDTKSALQQERTKVINEIRGWLYKELKGVDTNGKCHEEIFQDFEDLVDKLVSLSGD
jgi:hypothetical protein